MDSGDRVITSPGLLFLYKGAQLPFWETVDLMVFFVFVIYAR